MNGQNVILIGMVCRKDFNLPEYVPDERLILKEEVLIMVYVILYIIGFVLTFVISSIFLDDPKYRDTKYEFSHFPFAILWPISLVITLATALTVVANELSHKIHDVFHERCGKNAKRK